MKNYEEEKYWSDLKKILNEIDILIPFKEAEIWRIHFGVNIGIEIDGKGESFERPAIVVRRLNKDHALVVPITRSEWVKDGIHVAIRDRNLDPKSVAVVTQLQAISNKRFISIIGIISKRQFNQVIEGIIKILSRTQKT